MPPDWEDWEGEDRHIIMAISRNKKLNCTKLGVKNVLTPKLSLLGVNSFGVGVFSSTCAGGGGEGGGGGLGVQARTATSVFRALSSSARLKKRLVG